MCSTQKICVFTRIQGLYSHIQKSLSQELLKKVHMMEVSPPTGDSLTDGQLQDIQNAQVLLADPGLISQHGLAQRLPSLRWMMSTWAGVDGMLRTLDPALPKPNYTLTRFGGAFGQHMAEFVIGQMISHERRFPAMRNDQKCHKWGQSAFNNYRLLSQLTIGILGLGDIGREVARAAHSFGITVHGLVRHVPDEKLPFVAKYWLMPELHNLLGCVDYVVSVLPSTPATVGLLAGDTLAAATRRPVLINIGRGDLLPDADIVNALDKGWLSAAVLDVFSPEPLREDSPLWDHPAVTITPHVSAVSFGWQVGDKFVQNLQRYLSGEELEYKVDWQAGY